MRRSINKTASASIDAFLERSGTGSITIRDGFRSTNLFQNLEERKRCIAYARAKGLDVFKRGTKEPERIASLFASATWEEVKQCDPEKSGALTMWD